MREPRLWLRVVLLVLSLIVLESALLLVAIFYFLAGTGGVGWYAVGLGIAMVLSSVALTIYEMRRVRRKKRHESGNRQE